MTKSITIKVEMEIDTTAKQPMELEDLKLAIENAVSTPDNEFFGIKKLSIFTHEMTHEYKTLVK